MSYFTYEKRKTTLKSILVILGLTICAFALMASPAYADPEKKVEDPVETIDEKKETSQDAIDTVPPIAIPEVAEPETAVEDPAVKQPAEFLTPMPSVKEPMLGKAQACYKQENGVTECICDGDKECAELTSSEVCEPGTNWRNDDGLGGCTKKTE